MYAKENTAINIKGQITRTQGPSGSHVSLTRQCKKLLVVAATPDNYFPSFFLSLCSVASLFGSSKGLIGKLLQKYSKNYYEVTQRTKSGGNVG